MPLASPNTNNRGLIFTLHTTTIAPSATPRDEEGGAKDSFGYDYANQLTSATYNATPTPTPPPPTPTPTPRPTPTPTPTPTPPPPTPTPTPPRVAAPVFNPPGQNMGTHPARSLIVYLSTATGGAQMRYTTNGSTPTATSGTLINGSSGSVTILANRLVQLKAVAFKTGMTTSTVTSGTYNTTDPTLSPDQAPPETDVTFTPPPRRSVTYLLDALNRRSMNDNGVVTNYTYTSNGMNQFTTVGSQSPVYDGDFHLYSYNGWTYVYDADGRLTSTTASGHSAQFVYDGLGRCVKRTIDGVVTLFTYDGWKPIVEWNSAGAMVAWNIYGAGPDEILFRWQTSVGYLHYHLDRQGNVQFLLNSANAGIEKYRYDAFGAPRITDWAGNVRTQSAYGNRFLFGGREYLSALGIYDYRHRMYHPGLGRFLQVDPTGFGGGDNNLYRYVGNNPANRSDANGLGEPARQIPWYLEHSGLWG